jgi:RNA polymerase sigma-70 factor (ECF subfamily)
VLAYQDMLYNQAYRMINEPRSQRCDPDALSSPTASSILTRGGSFKAWLRIVTNLCYDELRRKRRLTTPPNGIAQDEEEIESPRCYPIRPNPDEAAERAELQGASAMFERAAGGVSCDCRVGRYSRDYLEAAESIGSPLGTVKSRLARARSRLRDCLQGYWELLPSSFRLVEESEE